MEIDVPGPQTPTITQLHYNLCSVNKRQTLANTGRSGFGFSGAAGLNKPEDST